MSFLSTQILDLDEHTAPWWEDPISDIVQLDDGSIACCGSEFNHVQIWCPNTGSLIQEINFHEDWDGAEYSINRMAVFKNGMLACGGTSGSLIICDPKTGFIKSELKGHDICIKSLYVHHDKSLVSFSLGIIKIWNYTTGNLKKDIKAGVCGDSGEGELILSNDQLLLTENGGPIWDLAGSGWGKELGFDIGQTFYCDESKILGVDMKQQLYMLNTQLGKRIISSNTGNVSDSITKIASLSDGRVITGHENGVVKIWETNSHLSIKLFDDLPIDVIFIMKDNRIITFACDKGKIWSLSKQ